MAASAGSTAWRPRSRRCARRAARTACCCSTAATRWQGSLDANRTKGQDVIDCVKLLRPDAMTGHWEFTYGEERVKEIVDTARLSVPRAQHPRHRMAGAGVSRLQDVRQGRREDRGARRGLCLYAARQSALDDAEMDVRHSRGRRARQCRQGAPRRRAACRAAVAQRLRLRPQARDAASPAST